MNGMLEAGVLDAGPDAEEVFEGEGVDAPAFNGGQEGGVGGHLRHGFEDDDGDTGEDEDEEEQVEGVFPDTGLLAGLEPIVYAFARWV